MVLPLHSTGNHPADFKQAQELWKVLKRYPNQQEHLAHNIAVHAAGADAAIKTECLHTLVKSLKTWLMLSKGSFGIISKKISVNETRKANLRLVLLLFCFFMLLCVSNDYHQLFSIFV